MEMEKNNPPSRKNIWNLILGILFVGYGSYRLYSLSNDIEGNVLGFILAIAFIAFGFYDLWKYNKGL
ncbi:hypothetical protein BH23BAC2_BH23BAC2_21800 [soil metagenome]